MARHGIAQFHKGAGESGGLGAIGVSCHGCISSISIIILVIRNGPRYSNLGAVCLRPVVDRLIHVRNLEHGV